MPSYGSFSSNTVQLGQESTAGTAVAATAIWRGEFGGIEDTRTRETVLEQIGLTVQAERSYTPWLAAQCSFPSTPLTYEQVLYPLSAGIKDATPTGAGPYVYTYAFSTTTTQNTIQTYTIESGNTQVTADQAEMPYSFCTELTLSGNQQESWMMESTWMGQQRTVATNTTGLSLATVEEAMFSNTVLKIDATGGTMGSTAVSNVMLAAEIRIPTGIQFVPIGDGTLYATDHKITGNREITFSFTFELEDTSVVADERAFYVSDAIRLFNLTCAGTSSRDLAISFAGKYDNFQAYQNTDNNTTVVATGHAVYSPDDSEYFDIVVTNNLAAIV